MKIAFNPSTVAALTTPPNNKDITFDLRGRNIFARGVKFYGTDTNTWRDIKINNVSIGSHTLDLRNGSNTTLTNTNGVVTINSTWRPVVDNLTSDSTTSSLSAKQGKVLKALIDGKSNSDHNHDGRYAVSEHYGGFKKSGRLPISGFYQSTESESGGNAPWSNWMHLINCQYASTNDNYALQIAASFFDNNTFKIRVTNNNVNNSWRDIIHSGNISSQSVNYANSAGNANTLDGYPANGSNDRPYGHIPTIESDGVMEVGRYIDFHNDNNGKHDFSTRLQSTGNYGNEVNLPSASGTLALINDVNNYYWANVKISASSSTTTSPTVLNLTATNSIRMGNILLEYTNEINNSANDSIHLNLRNSGDVSLCVGGGKVGIGTMYPSQELYVLGNTYTKGFGIGIQYLSESGLLPTISPGDGYTYRCLEIGRPTKVSCIIADKVYLSGVRGILLKFMQGFDGQIVLLKDLENYGSGNGYFWVMPSGCKIIKADSSNILINQNQISNTYDDGRSRFFIYSSKYSAWIEFRCS